MQYVKGNEIAKMELSQFQVEHARLFDFMEEEL